MGGPPKNPNALRRKPEWKIWWGMRQRCENPNATQYKDYGGRGIGVWAGWQHDFASFFACVGPRPSNHHTLDRIDNNRGYEPGNVRWATWREQHANTRASRFYTAYGVTMTIMQWSRALGAPYMKLWHRIDRGLSPEQVLGLHVAGI